jgi:hypothetical protein
VSEIKGKWTGEVNGLKVEFFQGETFYTADIKSPVPFHPDIVVISVRRDGEWRHATVRCGGVEMTPFYTLLLSKALDVAWRIAAGINEELGIENDEGIASRPGPIKPGTVKEKP